MDDEATIPAVPTLVDSVITMTSLSANQQLVGADPNRLVLLVTSADGTGGVSLRLGGVGNAGFAFTTPTGGWCEFTWAKHGTLVQRALYTGPFAPTGGVSIATLRRQ